MIDTAEAGRQLGVTRSRVLKLIKAGRLPAVKLGRDWVIQERDLDLVRVRRPGRAGWATYRRATA